MLGITALALMFASLLSLGLVVRGDFVDSAAVLLVGYVALIGGIGVGSFTYVVVVGHRLGLTAAAESDSSDEAHPRSADGLKVAPRLLPRTVLPAGMATWPRRRAKAVRPYMLASRVAPTMAPARIARPPVPAAAPRAVPATRSHPVVPSRRAADAALQVHVAATRMPRPRPTPMAAPVRRPVVPARPAATTARPMPVRPMPVRPMAPPRPSLMHRAAAR